MILEESLKNLHVGIRGGGSLVSHRAIFSKDKYSKNLYVVSSDTVHIFNTTSGDCTGLIQTPKSTPIANILVSSAPGGEILIILTESGELLKVSPVTYEFLEIVNINLSLSREWVSIRRWLNILELSPGVFLFVGHPENSEEIMVYQATRDLESRKSKYIIEKLSWRILASTHAVAVGCSGELMAAIQADSVCMVNTKTKVTRWHKSGTRIFTCVACHPHEWVVATGDDSGRILLWRNFLEEKSPPKTVFHWHTLPVADLCFTTDGTRLLSGGSECCLVRWDISDALDKKILPRMGLPIRHVSVSYSNDLAAVSHADNCINLVDGANNILRTLQNITQCYIPESPLDENVTSTSLGGGSVFQAGLHLDPNTKSLFMNGKPGHLQSYSLREDKHLHTLDITQQNYVTADRRRAIPNADVTHIAFSEKGRWLATIESLIEKTKYYELRLKFWKFDQTKQVFILNTCINWPHENGIVNLKIQPIDDKDPSLTAATSGRDKSFKTFSVVYDTSVHGKSDWWTCDNVGTYRDQTTGPLAFSQDGSVLAVSFEHTLTLWKVENYELTGTLSHSKLQEDIRLIEFSTHPTSHLVVCCTKKNLVIWDVIALSLVWTVPFEADSIAVDRMSNLVAIFSTKGHLYFFKPETPEPLAIHNNVSRSKIVSSLFVPTMSRYELRGPKSMLIFINSSQELCVLLSRESSDSAEVGTKLKIQKGTSTLTPFAKLIAEKTVSSVGSSRQLLQGTVIGIPGSKVIREIMDASPHTMPSVSFFCNQLLSAISVELKESEQMDQVVTSLQQSEKFRFLKQSDADDTESDSDSDNEFVPRKFGQRLMKMGITIAQVSKPVSSKASETVNFEVDLDEVANDVSWIEAISVPK